MAAFRRRTTFAAPVIVTVAAGCSKADRATPSDYVETFAVAMQNMRCHATARDGGARDIECPPGMSGHMTMTVARRADGVCLALPGKHVTPCPLAPGQRLAKKLGLIWTIEKRGTDCHAEEEDACPPGLDCNPPKPRTFPCPPGVTEERPLRFAELPDATCVVVPDECFDTSCATAKVECPPEYQPTLDE
jgi:hypothetical protein